MASSLEEIPDMKPDSDVRDAGVAPSVIGVVAESNPAENRVAATPETVAKLIGLGYRGVVEHDAGTRAEFADAVGEFAVRAEAHDLTGVLPAEPAAVMNAADVEVSVR